MPENTDPNAIPDAQYFAGMQALADRVGDAGLHTDAEKWLIENTDYRPEVSDGENR